MNANKKNKKIEPPIVSSSKQGTKWQELANFISRENRAISIIEDFEKDPNLKKIHTQRDKIFSKEFSQNQKH